MRHCGITEPVLQCPIVGDTAVLRQHNCEVSLLACKKEGKKSDVLGFTKHLNAGMWCHSRNYYVTGKLSRRIYADNCYFDSPIPDTPVTGLQKYVDAISHLFYHKTSKVQLLDIKDAICISDYASFTHRLEGTLMLPWRPKFKAYTGCTLYTLDERGLVAW
eukprot:jgi/Bigna1/71211/fgenesh1_pg.14_\